MAFILYIHCRGKNFPLYKTVFFFNYLFSNSRNEGLYQNKMPEKKLKRSDVGKKKGK